MDWNDSLARLAHLEAVGPDQYNRDLQAHQAANVLAIVNGYPLRVVGSRFGRLVAVGGTTAAFTSEAAARAHAETLPPGAGA